MLRFVGALGLALRVFAQPSPPPLDTAEMKALQAHFERVIATRHEAAFKPFTSPAQWEPRKVQLRRDLERMLWHDYSWPATPPPARVTHRTEYGKYTIENIVLETAPKLYLTANLYLPRDGAKP